MNFQWTFTEQKKVISFYEPLNGDQPCNDTYGELYFPTNFRRSLDMGVHNFELIESLSLYECVD